MINRHALLKNCTKAFLAITFNTLCLYASLSSANTVEPDINVPAPLQEWVNWASYKEADKNKEKDCPYSYNDTLQHCTWPSTLSLKLSNLGGNFTQEWMIYSSDAKVQLPGDAKHWPQNIRSNNIPLIVEDINGIPFVKLAKGQHSITGQFKWATLPKSLGMTPKLGLLSLRINGKSISNPKFNQQNTLWLSQNDQADSKQDNLLDVQVFRKINDSHPIEIETAIKLRVSGKQRNIDLAPVMLENFIPLNINSRLPARMDGKKLTVQLRPGEWQIKVTSRAVDNLSSFTLPTSKAPWPQEEIWVFAANSAMRQVEISGVNSIDPSQTRLSDDWKSLPAYLIKPEQSLELKTIRRGKSEKNNDQLTLNRQMWLDSNGKAYTIKDELKGRTELSRLNVINNLQLGSVNIHQQPQLITRLDNEGLTGVEVRHQNIQLTAESRYEESRSNIPVSGWHSNIKSINTQLHLPPGWRLFFVNGVDNLPKSWLRQWSLLDLFLVLVITFACGKLFSKTWGGIALVTLVLTWHEANAPNFIWIALLITVALVKFVPDGKFKRFSQWGFIAFQCVLALIILPYMIDNIRYSLYPQLENRAVYTQARHIKERVSVDTVEEALTTNSSRVGKISKSLGSRRGGYPEQQYQKNLQSIDPNNQIQTGPGLPTWQGKERINLRWSGPIKAEQTSQLILIPPLLTAILRVLGIILLLLLASRFVASNFNNKPLIPPAYNKLNRLYGLRSVAVASMLFSLLAVSSIDNAEAKTFAQASTNGSQTALIPRQDILDELKTRLDKEAQNKAPECLPHCAQIESMNLSVQNNVLTIRLRAHAAENTSIPLPGSGKTWLPQTVLLNDTTSTQLTRDNEEHLWIRLSKGLHTIVLRGALSQASTLPISLPLKPHHVSANINPEQWTIDGINKNGNASQQLQLTRVLKDSNNTADWQANFLPAFVTVDRYLELGLDWRVITTVSRVSNADIPININIDLLTNEKPLSEQFTVKNGKINVKLDARQTTIRWISSLPVDSSITLQASKQDDYLETWRLNANAIWHWQAEGIPVNQQQNIQQQAIPVWRPWPGESLLLKLDRPTGIKGQSITVQNSTLKLATGKRAKDFSLQFTALSSRGTQHEIILPEGSDIQKISIDTVEQSIQQVGDTLTLTLKPGKQVVDIAWREDGGLNTLYHLPRVDLNLNSVNAITSISLPRDRWLLWTFGPTTGPAVLFWGIICALLILAIILGRSKITPLRTWHWALLALGLSQTHSLLILILIAWLVAVNLRSKLNTDNYSARRFNTMQIMFAGLSVLALLILAGSVANGLLGSPSMSVAGNSSNAYLLRWYEDRTVSELSDVAILSLPLWVYRMLMLAWALWLAMAILRWLQSAWAAFNTGGLWRATEKLSVQAQENKDS